MPTLRHAHPAWLLAGLLAVSACAEPPTREINQAQGAIDAARSAGAAQHATEELAAADAALKRAHAAVTERDYRQALSSALDARDRARAAARESATKMAQLGRDAAQAIENAARAVEVARTTLAPRPGSREARGELARTQAALTATAGTLQEARSALAAGDYPKALTQAQAVLERVRVLSVEAAKTGPQARPAARGSGRG